MKGRYGIAIALIALGTSGCNDPRSARELLSPEVEKTVELAPQGPRWGDGGLVFTNNIEFVVVRAIDVNGAKEELDAPLASRVVATVRFRDGEPDPSSVQEILLGIAGERLEVSLKANGLRLTDLRIDAGQSKRFKPGDEIRIDAVVERTLGIHATLLSAPITLPAFRTHENDYRDDPIRALAWSR